MLFKGYLHCLSFSDNEKDNETAAAAERGKKMSIEEKASGIQEDLETNFRNIGKGRYGRVLKMAHRPAWDEYKRIVMITGIGIIIIGAVGFAIMWLMNYLPGYF